MLVDHDRLGDLIADTMDRIHRGHRVLEDHRDLFPAEPLQFPLLQVEQVAAPVENLSRQPGARTAREAEDRQRCHALAGARFADDAEHLAGLDLEADVVDCSYDTFVCRELNLEVANTEESVGHRRSFSPHEPRTMNSVGSRIRRGAERSPFMRASSRSPA